MSTSLAEQLKRLRVPQTDILKAKDKKRPSLLFDPSEAANHSRETVYQIGRDGLEELIERNPLFEQFQHNLFDVSSKDLQRAVQDSETNKRLDAKIKKFLHLLSPYFLNNCAYKALEWLIYRFQVQKYNKEDVLMLILPYHESNIFVRVLQLINVRQTGDKWYWLRPLQKPGIHLPKLTLFSHAASDPYFLKTVSNYVCDIVKVHENPFDITTIFNFYWQTFTGALEYSQQVNEAQVSQMLPVLLQGLRSDVADFVAASYVITAKLSAKVQLTDSILNSFCTHITSGKVLHIKSEAVLCLMIIHQTQKDFKNVNEKIVWNLCKLKGVTWAIQKHNEAGVNIYPFLDIYITIVWKLIFQSEPKQECMKFIDDLLDNVKLDNGFVPIIIQCALDCYELQQKYPTTTVEWVSGLFSKIERQYPTVYDTVIKQIFADKQMKRKRSLQKIINKFYQVEKTFDLFDKLYNSNATIRAESIYGLRKHLNFLKENDKGNLQGVVLDRLNDENPHVVRNTLQVFQHNFREIFDDTNQFNEALFDILRKCIKQEVFTEVVKLALNVSCSYFSHTDVRAFISLMPFLLPLSETEVKWSKTILKSKYAQHALLSAVKGLENASRKWFFAAIHKQLEDASRFFDATVVLDVVKAMKIDDSLSKYLTILLLSGVVANEATPELSSSILDEIFALVRSAKLVFVSECNAENYIRYARNDQLPLQGVFACIQRIIMKTCATNENIANEDFINTNPTYHFYLQLLNILLNGCCMKKPERCLVYANVLKIFLERFCKDFPTTVKFLLNVACTNCDGVDGNLQIYCLKTISNILSKEPTITAELVQLDSFVVPYLLICLGKENAEIRIVALSIIEFIFNTIAHLPNGYTKLMWKLLKFAEEIKVDYEQISAIIATILSDHDLNDALQSLCNVIVNDKSPMNLIAGITSLVSQMENIRVYEMTATRAIQILHTDHDINAMEADILYRNINRFNVYGAENLTENSPILDMIKLAFKTEKTIKHDDKDRNVAALVLNQIDRDTFAALRNNRLQEDLLNEIIHVASVTQHPEIYQAAFHVFKRIDLDVALVLNVLQQMQEIQSAKQSQTRKRRVSVIPTIDILDTIEWRKGVTVLEFLQDKKKIRNTNCILPVLFGILKKCLDFDEQTSVEYVKQLTLMGILQCCNKSKGLALPENAFDMQLVVQCIRASPNPQTHHHALLLLAFSATILPKEVLNHIIAVFTFVGSSILRHDDAYSFQIIVTIIDTIIPILIQDGKRASIAQVLRVFTDALLDIPEHRRMPLFKQLLAKLDAKENLYLFLLLIFEAHVVHGHLEKRSNTITAAGTSLRSKVDNVPQRLAIAAELCQEFPPDIAIGTCNKLFEYLRALPEEKGDEMEVDEGDVFLTFDIQRYSSKQFRHYKYTLITFVGGFLSNADFVAKLAELNDEQMLELEQLYRDGIINILSFIQTTSKVADRNAQTPQAQYWKVVLHHTYDTLDSLNALLTPQMFLLVIRGLMVHTLNNVRRRALELLNTKLQHQSDFFANCDESELYALVPPLMNLIKGLEEDHIELDQEIVIQTALLSLKLLTRHLTHGNEEKFQKILDFIANLLNVGKSQDNVLASLVLCLAELCNNLKAHAISHLNKFMPALVKILRKQKRYETPSLLLLSDLTAIMKILDSLPLFISPYLEKLLVEVCTIAAKWGNVGDLENPKLTTYAGKIRAIREKIGTVIPLRVLLPATEQCYAHLVAKGWHTAIGPLMDILSHNLQGLNGPEAHSHLTELTEFFMNALQFRENANNSHDEAVQVESHIIKPFVTLILKLSETTFRPIYYKLYDWAVRGDAKTERIVTFYNLSSCTAECLKGLFVLFAGHFLTNAALLLNNCNTLKNDFYFDNVQMNLSLLNYILKTLHCVFTYDTHHFINKERFDVLMQPLIDQLENTLDGVEALQNDLLIPCIVQFAVATADDALWKQMNYQILLKTRHSNAEIRLVALECLKQVAKKLGEDFLPLLPETIPFLAELLEDEDENVEKTCQKAIQELEKVLGEPLQKYF